MQNTAPHHSVYILSGPTYGPIYCGATADLGVSLRQHRAGRVSNPAFRIDRLVYVERYTCPLQADARREALKTASRQWLDAVITAQNPNWQDLAPRRIEAFEAA